MLALRMAQRGYKITLMERRPDLRDVHQDAGRSINLALSDRGLKGIRLVGLEEEVRKLCIPMNGRMLHDNCLLYTSPSPRDRQKSRMPSSA